MFLGWRIQGTKESDCATISDKQRWAPSRFGVYSVYLETELILEVLYLDTEYMLLIYLVSVLDTIFSWYDSPELSIKSAGAFSIDASRSYSSVLFV